jgi:hypothetical protein
MKLNTFKVLIASILMAGVTPAIADTSAGKLFGISADTPYEDFAETVKTTLKGFRGGWACSEAGDARSVSCVSHDSNVEEIGPDDGIVRLIVRENMQVLAASCGMFELCDNFSLEAMKAFFDANMIVFSLEDVQMSTQGRTTIVAFKGGAFIVDGDDMFSKLVFDK